MIFAASFILSCLTSSSIISLASSDDILATLSNSSFCFSTNFSISDSLISKSFNSLFKRSFFLSKFSFFLSKFSSLFIIPLLKIQMEKFNWGGNGATLTRLKRTRIVLPIDSYGNPNWKFMEAYIKQEMKKQSQRVITYYENKLMKLGFELLDYDVEWKEFKVKDIFEFKKKSSKGLNYLEKNAKKYFLVVNRQKTFDLEDVDGND